ncbi:SOS response-associated peptidase [Hasllibacter sp. MH4015]|uniref:SOS response-associated peptidase n=1 Tax=Hasllibacter sp. MH4015 TaxID=2854029 RepID=UPI001CD37D36|nr:SOS response-associated peptidase [Hasllibacter sp. MH4015]
MCGRLTLTHPNDALARLFDAAPANDLPEPPNYNLCPTQDVSVVVSDGARRALRPMRWGFIPHWYKTPTGGPLLINARAETIAEKPAFRAAVRARRCLIPAAGFYEWTKGADDARLPWYFSRPDGAPLVFAGIWQIWDKGEDPLATCAIVTTGASDWMAETHHREPVVLAEADWPTWLGEADAKAAPLMKPAPEGLYQRWRVDPAVNSNRAHGPELITPLAA